MSPTSPATPYRRPRDNGLEAGRRAATAAPVLPARAFAMLRHSALDRRLAAGADATGDRQLAVRAWQITRTSVRERVAAALDAILIDAERPRPHHGAAVCVCGEEVEVARDEILRLAERLRDRRPVRPRGVALARQLLTDGVGPLYVASPNDELWRQVRRAVAALD
jgi:HAMP domain-containing protein